MPTHRRRPAPAAGRRHFVPAACRCLDRCRAARHPGIQCSENPADKGNCEHEAWLTHGSRHLPWRRRPVAAAVRTIACWSAVTRLQTRGHLMWAAQLIAEARRAAQGVLDDPDRSLATVADTLDVTLPPRSAMPARAQNSSPLPCARPAATPGNSPPPHRVSSAERSDAWPPISRRRRRRSTACATTSAEQTCTADLTHLYLGGLRWDAATQWPDAWREWIRTASIPVDGIHQIRDH